MKKIKSKFKQKIQVTIFLVMILAVLVISTYNGEVDKNQISLGEEKLKISEGSDPAGLIALWSGPLSNIPTGWKLCNGSSDTPDLSDNFFYVTDSKAELRATGGFLLHSHRYSEVPTHNHGDKTTSEASPSHRHRYNSGTNSHIYNALGGSWWLAIGPGSSNTGSSTASHNHGGVTYPEGFSYEYTTYWNNIPPYYELAFIEKESDVPGIPIGLITMWAGNVEDIPEDWALCNGSNGTPDLRNQFILGGEEPGNTGGTSSHSHGYTHIPSHQHSLSAPDETHRHSYDNIAGHAIADGIIFQTWNYNSRATDASTDSTYHQHYTAYEGLSSCETQASELIPPYFKTAFIMNTKVTDALPMGSIALWGDLTDNVPAGWNQCNGTYGTPDMRNKFIRGIGTGEQPGITGGASSHNHEYTQLPYHRHSTSSGSLGGHVHSYYSPNNVVGVNILGDKPVYDVPYPQYKYTSYTGYTHDHNVGDYIGSPPYYTWTENVLPPYIKLNCIQKKTYISDISPNDGALGIDNNPTLNVEVFDFDGDGLTVTFYNASDDSVIGTDTVPSGSGTASLTWSDLSWETVYSWYVTVDDGSDTIQFETWSFMTNRIPNQPINPSPNNGAGEISYDPTLSVYVVDIDGGDLYVSFCDDSDDSIIGTDIVYGADGTASVTWSGLSAGTEYSWYAIANDGLNSTQSATWSFTTNNIPNPPSNPSPNNGAGDISYDPTLSVDVWDIEMDDLTVKFYNASDNNIIGTDIVAGGSGTASVTWSGLSAGTEYSWYAIANDSLSSSQSASWSFTTNYVPNQPINPSPDGGEECVNYTPSLSVNVLDYDGDDLTVTFYDDSDDSIIGTDIVAGGSGTASVTWSGLSYGTSYSWYTIADDGLSLNQSDTWTFTTNHGPYKPINPSPYNGSIVSDKIPRLSVDIFDYEGDDVIVTFYNASDDSIIGMDTVIGGSGTAFISLSRLSSGTSLSWYVIADDGISLNQSGTWTFKVIYQLPDNEDDDDDAQDEGATIMIVVIMIIASVGAGIGLISVLIKKGIIDFSRRKL